MTLSRRDLIKAGGASAALLLARPLGALADPLGPAEFATDRASRLFPGTRLVHADMHNHTLLSDGNGDAAKAFVSMRDAGLDVASLTDHSTVSWGAVGDVDPCGRSGGYEKSCRSVAGITEAAWARTAELANAENRDGSFTAIRGFEWSSPFLGHMNVWLSERWIDPLHTGGIGPEGLGEHLHENVPGAGPVAGPLVDEALRAGKGASPSMAPFYRWLGADPTSPGFGGGADGIAGFNHPGREQGRFGYFRYDAAIAPRVVSLELFNRRDDYLFAEYAQGQPSPLVECLNAGWRVGILGVTDEHGTDWGYPDGKGRGGLWVSELSRQGVREAMLARRFFATNLKGLRLDVAARSLSAPAGDLVRMGGDLRHTKGAVRFSVDLDRGSEWAGKELEVQVLRPDTAYPKVVHVEDVVLRGEVVTFDVPLDVADGPWVVLRVADPAAVNNEPGPPGHRCNNRGVAYASPFWLVP